MMLHKEIKHLVKQSLGSRVAPKSLDTFYYFHYVYNKSETPYISTEILNHRLGINSKSYKKYFDMWIDIADEYVAKEKCRLIKTWSTSFLELMSKTEGLEIPQSFFEKMYWQTLRMKESEKEHLKSLLNEDFMPFYHNTINSSFRWYNPKQNTTKEEKSEIFKGCWDIDIDSCFSSICYYDLNIKDERLNPALKDDFRSWVMNDLNVDYAEAKEIISRLFTGTHTKYNKIEWYNNMFNNINKAVWKKIGKLKKKYPDIKWSHHQYFTFVEQGIIDKVIKKTNLVLRMHDGIIVKDEPDIDKINQSAYPYTFSKKEL